uniref:Uncharacterized protein n=1 Tax=Panagrolaimus superbus TaxID=310955 RepID=A0A914XS21_9BILA
MIKILKYTPTERLSGPKILAHSWFKEIFDPATKRYNGKSINILSMNDYRNAIGGDRESDDAGTSATGSKSNEDDDNENNDL